MMKLDVTCKNKQLNKFKVDLLKKVDSPQNGITLISLIITIIILIILIGVATSLTLSQNGIFSKAKQARENYMQATNEEQEKIANVEKSINEIAGGEYNSNIGPVAGGSYDNPYIPTGYTHIGTEDWNSGYRISDTGDETGNIFVWVPCVLDQSKVKAGDKVETFKKTTTGMYNKNSYGLSPTDTSVTDVEPTNAIKTSVGIYGGFYIAAYEAGVAGEKDNISLSTRTATDGSVKPLSKLGCGVWNAISRANSLIVAASMIDTEDGVKSGLISGECWDTTLQWMVNTSTNASTNAGYDIDSTGKGWYKDVSSNTRHTTGYYGVNNIYDMAGNVWKWTTENCTYNDINYAVTRGGRHDSLGRQFPVAYRYQYGDYATEFVSFRVVLYK